MNYSLIKNKYLATGKKFYYRNEFLSIYEIDYKNLPQIKLAVFGFQKRNWEIKQYHKIYIIQF
ncbi:MAG: hypothetical protein L6Q54_02020 [Leptospiraceae bacterium]|nr:hypothetical protein [Leptospiraceae bacterium]